MYGDRIKYYRIKNKMNKRELSKAAGIRLSELNAYESERKQPDLKTIRILMSLFRIKLADIIGVQCEHQEYEHLEFRKHCRLSKTRQDYIRLSAEDYFDRFFLLLRILDEDNKITRIPSVKSLKPEPDAELAAINLRRLIGFPKDGPIPNIIDVLENKGILLHILPYECENSYFFGMNGTVNGLPYIVLNSGMTSERLRSTLVHELVHIFFDKSLSSLNNPEKYINAVSGAFLFPKSDAINELGRKREKISSDMIMVAKEYGISLQMLAKRAHVSGIITDKAYESFNIKMNQNGWRKNEPSRIPCEAPRLFEQMTLRAVSEDKISIQKGAELMNISREDIQKRLIWSI